MSKQGNNKGGKEERGFAAMDDEKQREIASKGGQAAHEKGTAHEFNSEEAREAGRKGGQSRGSESGNQGGNQRGGNQR
ncbi:MAG: KGG domain-containing protein [Anaerolineae bacterium]